MVEDPLVRRYSSLKPIAIKTHILMVLFLCIQKWQSICQDDETDQSPVFESGLIKIQDSDETSLSSSENVWRKLWQIF